MTKTSRILATPPINLTGYELYSAKLVPTTGWPAHADADLQFSQPNMNASREYDNPNNNITLHFVTGTGTKNILNSPTSTREYYLIDDTFYYRLSRRQALPAGRKASPRHGYKRILSGKLHIPIRKCEHLNGPLKALALQAIKEFKPPDR